ncbi:MAG: alpha/beta hydrolase [Clostridia bacterium]|nr:alpha/beta hydrolase [Clostridia bacterium]
MVYNKVDLYDYFGLPKPEGGEATLEYCLHAASDLYATRVRPAMIAVAGGGYGSICEREGEPVGAAFFGAGYHLFVMRYSVTPLHYPTQLIEGAMAVAYIRKNAEALRVDPHAIGAVGSSAGGHFVGMLATLTGEDCVKEALGADAALARPDAVVMCYPVITAGAKRQPDSIERISGGDPDLAAFLSLEHRVTADSAPAFIWATQDDGLVPVENAVDMTSAYIKAGVPCEFHMYQSGPHGLALATRATTAPLGRVWNSTMEDYVNPAVATWFGMCITWLEKHGFTVKD